MNFICEPIIMITDLKNDLSKRKNLMINVIISCFVSGDVLKTLVC